MILRHFTKAHYLFDIINSSLIRRERPRHERVDKRLNRAQRREEKSMMQKVPAFTWLTSAQRANTSFACCDMGTRVKFNAAFYIEIDSDEINVVPWRDYQKILCKKKHLSDWVHNLNMQAAHVGDDDRDYYVVVGDIDLSSVAYRVQLMRYSDGVEFARYVRSNAFRLSAVEQMALAYETCCTLFDSSMSSQEFIEKILWQAANDDKFSLAA